jgi:hypothetical protein
VPVVATSTLAQWLFGPLLVLSDAFVVFAPSSFLLPWSVAMMADIEALKRCISSSYSTTTTTTTTVVAKTTTILSDNDDDDDHNDTPLLSQSSIPSNVHNNNNITKQQPIDENSFAKLLAQLESTTMLGGVVMPTFIVVQLSAFGFNFVTLLFATYSPEKTTFNGWYNVLVVSLWSMTPILTNIFNMAYVNTHLSSITRHIGRVQRQAYIDNNIDNNNNNQAALSAQRCVDMYRNVDLKWRLAGHAFTFLNFTQVVTFVATALSLAARYHDVFDV